ncbi:4-hydroxybenzoate octaprenyltransferase [Aestuariivirga litoralis]|uniref:4-hydroxybenzoate octaprenyltransferase n=1 Tax=Aestuariivirga litoralis TaxID=2650924 RepID=UPI0018C6BBCF|nr:4-hydroxybenzoate octaprenyltransferase [Aestuariivirga litoralis]MBG1233432.1 4-hydroxybenzoate octaprenyltransferase [Aestuariivirga litoralis]
MPSSTTIRDAVKAHWAERLPAPLVPYAQLMRLERPIGWWLLLLPCWWGLALAQLAQGGGMPNLWHGFLFFIGAVVMRGAGCVVNDLADQDFDAKVDRTRNRPLPSGRVSRKQAFAFLAGLLAIGFIILLQFNLLTIYTSIASLVIVAIYPFMKRITDAPQLVLGLAFNWGALVGFTAQTNAFAPACFALYIGGIFWTLAYDTIYAHQDKDDDALIGVRSTALLFGKSTPYWLTGFFAAALIAIDVALQLASAPLIAHIGVLGAAIHAFWQVRKFDDTDGARLVSLFRANRNFGLLILVGMIAGCFLR